METLYRKVLVSEQNPTKSGEYFTNEGLVFYASTHKGFEHMTDPHSVYPDWWLEEIPYNSHQLEKLEADKEELLERLENLTEYGSTGEDAVEMKREIESLIQKHKQDRTSITNEQNLIR